MDISARIIEISVPVFLIVAIGWGYARWRQPDMAGFNRLTLDVLTPLLVYSALAGQDFDIAQHQALLLGGAGMILGSGLLAWPLGRWLKADLRSLLPVVMFNNCGGMGLPLALLAFGPANFGAAVALFSVNNLLHFSLGARLTSRLASTRELLLSPLMLATLLGFASALSDLRPPALALTGMRMLGDATLPMMLFSLGARLTQLQRADLRLGLSGALLRPLLGLAVALPLATLLGLQGETRAQLLLFATLPPAVVQFMLAERYQQEPHKVAAMIMLGNALALVFVPIGLALGL